MRRGQITVFIIIGLVLILSVAIVTYLFQSRAVAPIEREVVVPEDVQQVYDYVSTCVSQLGKEGLSLMGLQGGFITIPPSIERNPNSYVSADGVGIFKTPLWYYEGEDRTPPIDYLQRELELHIKNNLPDCVDGFSAFEGLFTIRELGQTRPVVTLADEQVIIDLTWPLEISTQNKRIEWDKFVVRYPVKLKQMWELADRTLKAENQFSWFENLTMDLMASNADIPLSGMEVFCGTKKWRLPQVKQEIQNLMYYNLPRVRVENTKYPAPLESERTYNRLRDQAEDVRSALTLGKKPQWPTNVPADVYEMNRMRFDVGSPETELKAAFTYVQDWPMLVNVQPSEGGILSTSQMKGPAKYLRFFCLNQWHFTYDVIYPIKMLIRDDTAFNGEGYVFQMAFPVIIEDNEESRQFFGLRRFQFPSTGVDFCEDVGTAEVDVRAKGFVDLSPVAQELEGAQVRYKCVNRECILGTTAGDGSGSIRLRSFLPSGCGNPVITAGKEGYLESSGVPDAQGRVDLQLTKLKKFNYSINIHPYYEEVDKNNPLVARNEDWLLAQTYSKLPASMHATVGVSLRGGNLEQYSLYPADRLASTETYGITPAVNNSNEVDFVLGDAQYDLDIMLFKGDLAVGGYHAENITIGYEELASADSVVFNVIEYRPLPEQSHQQAGLFLFLYERGTYEDGEPYAKALRPRFV